MIKTQLLTFAVTKADLPFERVLSKYSRLVNFNSEKTEKVGKGRRLPFRILNKRNH
jgi:hypothetical protein